MKSIKITKSKLTELIQRSIKNYLSENSSVNLISDKDIILDDLTQLLMMISGRIMSAKDKEIPIEILEIIVNQLEQVDGLLSKYNLNPEDSEIF